MSCPYCQNETRPFLTFYSRDYRLCGRCGLISRERRRGQEQLLTHFRDDYFGHHVSLDLDTDRTPVFHHAMKTIMRHRSGGRLLDVGAGTGGFAAHARERGWDVLGVEISTESVAQAKGRYNLPMICGTLADVPENERFDAITFVNVLEQCSAPWTELSLARSRLNPGGIVYARMVNGLFHSWVHRAAALARLQKSVDPYLVFHEYAFTPDTLCSMMHELGFSAVRVSNSLPSGGGVNVHGPGGWSGGLKKRLVYGCFRAVELLSVRRIVCAPSIDAVAFAQDTN